MVGSALMAPLGMVGSLAGAVGGAMAGSRAGSAATSASCNAVDKVQKGALCEECKAAANTRPANYQNFGGGRLGDSYNPGTSVTTQAPSAQPTVGDRVGQAASSAGESVSGAATSAGNWMRQSWSSTFGGGDDKDKKSDKPAGGSAGTFQAFAGSGHTLGSAAPAAPVAASQDAAAVQEKRRQQALAAARRAPQAQGTATSGAAPQAVAAVATPAQQALRNQSCAGCGNALMPGANFCMNCGMRCGSGAGAGQQAAPITPALQQLLDMGFPEDRARVALDASGGNAETAMEMLIG